MDINFVRVACIATLFANDLKHIHLHAKGYDFDKIHNLAEEYYDKMTDEADYLCELAMEVGESMVNPTNANKVVTDWVVEQEDEYDYSSCLHVINSKLSLYINSLIQLRESTEFEDVKSKLDDITRDWKKELEYKMAKRSNVASNTFVHSGIDDRTVDYAQKYFNREDV